MEFFNLFSAFFDSNSEGMFTQRIDPKKAGFNFGDNAVFVINPPTLLPNLFENNEKTIQESRILISDQNRLSNHIINTLKHNKNKFIQMINLLLSL